MSRYALLAAAFSLLCSVHTPARAYDALEACRAQSLLTEAIHDCLDNYLALVDQNLNDLTVYIDGQLRGSERAAFSRAQNSFYSYRRENCLWYLEIGGTRVQAEQVAKNCLSNMSQDRLSELQSLIADYQDNTFEEALALTGIDASVIAEPEPVPVDEATALPVETNEDSDSNNDDGLSAYLGAWQVICSNESAARRCTTDVPLDPIEGESEGAIMRITYRDNNRPSVELHFPKEELDSPDKLSWKIDTFAFGVVPGSIISVDDDATKQIINEVKFVRDELIPLFQSGTTVGVTVLDKVDSGSGKTFEATLVGFSKARSFASDYLDGKLP